MRARNRLPHALEGIVDARGSHVLDQVDEFRQQERAFSQRVSIHDRRGDVLQLEAEDEVGVREVLALERPRSVSRDIDTEGRGRIDCLRQRWRRAELQRAERAKAYGDVGEEMA
jgi:hypothetical protein